MPRASSLVVVACLSFCAPAIGGLAQNEECTESATDTFMKQMRFGPMASLTQRASAGPVYGYSITYKSTHQIDDIYFSKDGVRTIPIMRSSTQDGCSITQGGPCNGGSHSPWGPSGTQDNSGCWEFGTHSILCDHPITADTIHIHFWNDGYSSTSGYTVHSLDVNGGEIEVALDVGGRSGLDATDSLVVPATTVSAFGDPHLKNIKAESFEVRRAGAHTLVTVPRGAEGADALLSVGASVEPVESGCSPLFIRSLDIVGQWLGSVPALRFAAGSALPGESSGAVLQVGRSRELTIDEFLSMVPADMVKLSLAGKEAAVPSAANRHATLMTAKLRLGPGVKVQVSWTSERTPSASIAHGLWVAVTGLSRIHAAIGGLLGEDDHHNVTMPDPRCEGSDISLIGHTGQAAVAEASSE